MADGARPRRLVGVSLKMYFAAARTLSYVTAVLDLLADDPSLPETIDIFVIPDHISVQNAVSVLRANPAVWVGAQDCAPEDGGAFTGCVSPAVLAEVGVRIVEVGHAERRRLFGETDAGTAAKAAAVARNGMVPLICVGETERGAVSAAAVAVAAQVDAVLSGVPEDAEVVLAYEPVWAIGASEPASVDHVVGVVKEVRAAAAVRRRSGRTRIVYGGSAGPGLFAKLNVAVDGLFLGRFAHDPKVFMQTAREVVGS